MKRHIFLFATFIVLACMGNVQAQDQGNFSGSLELNSNFFMRDTAIGAANTPQYDNQLSGGEAWLNLNYNYKGFDFGLRFDAFLNSNLRNPQGSYSAQGIGYWHIRKKVNKLDITVGHIYDQIGSGIVFRSWESRPLFIDNALVGVRMTYDLIDKDAGSLTLKGFTGRQRRSFSEDTEDVVSRVYKPAIKGLSFDGFWSSESGKVSIAPGAGVVNRTLDDNTMNLLVANINTYSPVDSFIPKYNSYAFTAYNTLSVGDFAWYVEGAYKTAEGIYDPFADIFINKPGTVFYTSLAYSQKGFGITLEGKRTENYSLRVSPFRDLTEFNSRIINFIPPMARQNTYRLTARYNPATQELGELAFQGDIRFSPKRTLNFNLFGSFINDLDNTPLFREVHFNMRYRKPKKYSMVTGLQYLQYNQAIYEAENLNAPMVETFVPYIDFLYKFDKKKSLRTELQYMHTEQDFGQWIFALMEFSIAPNWIFTVSDMYNVKPLATDDALHYPTAGVIYNHKSNRFGLSYVKQVEGVVCSGGVCRFEPGFSGVKFNMTSTF